MEEDQGGGGGWGGGGGCVGEGGWGGDRDRIREVEEDGEVFRLVRKLAGKEGEGSQCA